MTGSEGKFDYNEEKSARRQENGDTVGKSEGILIKCKKAIDNLKIEC